VYVLLIVFHVAIVLLAQFAKMEQSTITESAKHVLHLQKFVPVARLQESQPHQLHALRVKQGPLFSVVQVAIYALLVLQIAIFAQFQMDVLNAR